MTNKISQLLQEEAAELTLRGAMLRGFSRIRNLLFSVNPRTESAYRQIRVLLFGLMEELRYISGILMKTTKTKMRSPR